MADGRDQLVSHAGEELRRIIAQRRRRRKRLLFAVLTICTTVPLVASVLWSPPVILVWNASSSAPIGLYRVQADEPVHPGDMVIAWTPEPARSLAASRRYLPANVPLVKRVAAVAGDRICAAGSDVSINGVRVAKRKNSDGLARPMPWWTGCRNLASEQYFLLMDRAESFDGRYFGITRRDHLVGRAMLLWAKPARRSNDG